MITITRFTAVAAFAVASLLAAPASAALLTVAGPNSSAGTTAIVLPGAPADVRDDAATNTGMQAFLEASGIVLASAVTTDQGSIAAGTRVDSWMIFLNTRGNTRVSHGSAANPVVWTFQEQILGTMSDIGGTLEAASSGALGAPGTIYPAAFSNRGLESNDYLATILGGHVLNLGMIVTEPGDWIRVATVSAVPLPAALWFLLTAIGGIFGLGKFRAARASA